LTFAVALSPTSWILVLVHKLFAISRSKSRCRGYYLSLLDNVSLDLQISCFSLQLDVTVIFPTAISKLEPCSRDATMENCSKGCAQQAKPLVMAGESEFLCEVGAKIICTQDGCGLALLGYKHWFFRRLNLFENCYVAADGRLSCN